MGALLNPDNRRSQAARWELVAHTTVMFIGVTICGALYLEYQRISYIYNREFPGAGDVLPPGPFGYTVLTKSSAINVATYSLFFFNQWLADGFLVGSGPCLIALVSNLARSSALSLLYYLFHELLDHRLPMFDVSRLGGYVFKPLQIDSDTLR